MFLVSRSEWTVLQNWDKVSKHMFRTTKENQPTSKHVTYLRIILAIKENLCWFL